MTDDQEILLRAAAATSTAILVGGGLGASVGYAFSPLSKRNRRRKIGATIGAISGAGTSVVFGVPFMCGLFKSQAEKDEIDRIQRPIRLQVGVGTLAATLAGGFVGSKVSRSHPIVSGLIGAAISGGLVVGALGATGCPQLPQTGTSGVFLNGAAVGGFP